MTLAIVVGGLFICLGIFVTFRAVHGRLSFFGHLHRTDPSQDHYRALQACIMGRPDDWRRKIGRPRQSWLRTVEADLRPMNLGLATSKRRAQVRSTWRKLIAMATSTTSSSIRRQATQRQTDLRIRRWASTTIYAYIFKPYTEGTIMC